jgi:hypothetical protein
VKWPLYKIRPRQQNPANREAIQDQGVPERIRKELALLEPTEEYRICEVRTWAVTGS